MLLNFRRLENFDNIYDSEQFEKDFEKIVKGNRERYHNWLRSKLKMLDKMGMKVLELDAFEPLSNTDPKLYSIRYNKSPVNPRVIYIYAKDNKIYLLTAFKEGSKKNSSDYREAIKVAQDRRKYIDDNQ